MPTERNYWLMKSEPGTYSIDDLERVLAAPVNEIAVEPVGAQAREAFLAGVDCALPRGSGFVSGGTRLGEPVDPDAALDHVFGLVLVNDWSARDIQKWEYQPLGPFNAKNFASTIGPWIVTLEALAPFRVPGPPRGSDDPPVLVHGYQGELGMIEIAVRREADALVVRVRDQAPPFDPTGIPGDPARGD